MLAPISYQVLYNKCKDPTTTGYYTHSYAHVASRFITKTRPKVTTISWALYPYPGFLKLTISFCTRRHW